MWPPPTSRAMVSVARVIRTQPRSGALGRMIEVRDRMSHITGIVFCPAQGKDVKKQTGSYSSVVTLGVV